MTDNTLRKNIDSARKWDPSAIFDSPAEWDDELASLKGFDVPDEQIIKTPVELASSLEEYDDLRRRCGRLWAYARVRSDEDTTDSTAQARLEKVNSLLGRLDAFASILESRIRQFDEETLVNAPVLEGYDHYIRDVFRRAGYTLKSDTREAVEQLQPVLDAPDSAFRTFMNGDYDAPTVERPDGESVTVSPNNRDQWLRHQNRNFRRAVHKAYCEAFDTAHDLLADAFGTAVDRNVRLADLRGYDSALEAALDEDPAGGIGQAFPTDAHHEMRRVIRENLDAYHRYYEAKRDHLGVDSLRPWDRYVSLVPDNGPEIPYERATELVINAVEPLGQAYQSRLRAYLANRRVDVYATEKKTSEGLAYTLGVFETDPYLLLNYKADLRSVFVLAHELGHAMHIQYANEHQPRMYSGFPQAISELPSNLHEVLLANYLAESGDRILRTHGIDTALRRFEDMFFRHALLATFTQQAHERAANGEPITPVWLDETYANLLAEFQEPLSADEETGRTWVGDNQAHRTYGSYQYVLGRASAHSVADRLENGDLLPETYQSFLQAGSSAYPMELFEDLGLDMTTSEPYENAIIAFDEQLRQIA